MNGKCNDEILKRLDGLNKSVRRIMEYTPLQYMLDAVSENPKIAEIYVDEEDNPQYSLILLGHYLFIGGKIGEETFRKIREKLFTKELRENLGILIVFYETDEIAELFRNAFSKIYDNERSLYYVKPVHTSHKQPKTYIKGINRNLIKSSVENLTMITEEVIGTGTYDDMEDFCKRGIGYTPIIDNRVCGFCTSEYPSQNAVAIGIEVEEKYQNQGIASAMTKSFLNQAALKDLDVYWECWKRNEESVKTALSCGFTKVADYKVLFIELIEK